MNLAPLKAAFKASGLWRTGMSLAEALARPVVADTLRRHAAALQINAQRRRESQPQQQELAL